MNTISSVGKFSLKLATIPLPLSSTALARSTASSSERVIEAAGLAPIKYFVFYNEL